MKALLSWLCEFVPELPSDDPYALGDTLSDIGLCCEEVRPVGGSLDGIVVARVLELSPHPDADRIQLVGVDAGDGEALQICCGAFNMAVGDLVPLATLGTTMPDGMEITRRKLRGEWSNGMLCSSRELGLDDDHAGIMILPATLTAGTGVSEALGIEPDIRFDLDVTPNRPDALSILGIARDLSARLGLPLEIPRPVLPSGAGAGAPAVGVVIDDPTLCGRFTARVLRGVPTGPSPLPIARRLTLMGMRPINATVDISNYVMLEYGQPNHAYDLAKVAGGRVEVRRAHEGERIVTLDGHERVLSPTDGIIVDGAGAAIGVAGVMGGAAAEVSAETTDVLLEMAWWDPATVRRSSTTLGLRSEASIRFERGVDPDIAQAAADRFAQLAIAQGATLVPGQVVAEGVLPPREPITVRPSRINALLGSDFRTADLPGLLDPIGFVTTPVGDDRLEVALPSWRPDATAEVDVVEEVARMWGYSRLGRRRPSSPNVGGLTARQRTVRTIRATLVALGASEAMPMPFLAPGRLEACGVRTDAVVVTNPLDARESVLRTSLLPGLIGALGYNAAHREHGLTFFEVGHCYASAPAGGAAPLEWPELAVVLGGGDAVAAVRIAARLVEAATRRTPTFTSATVAGMHPGRAGIVAVGGTVVGEVGEIDPAVSSAESIMGRVGWVRLELEALHDVVGEPRSAIPVSRFPSADIDLAFVVDEAVAVHEVTRVLREADPLVTAVEFFDAYRGDAWEGRRSLAFSVRLQATDHTLTDAEVAAARGRLVGAATTEVGATLR